jgi:hypothetical protein
MAEERVLNGQSEMGHGKWQRALRFSHCPLPIQDAFFSILLLLSEERGRFVIFVGRRALPDGVEVGDREDQDDQAE